MKCPAFCVSEIGNDCAVLCPTDFSSSFQPCPRTHSPSYTRTQLFLTRLFHKLHCHTQVYHTHNIVTHNFSTHNIVTHAHTHNSSTSDSFTHTTLSMHVLSHRQLNHTHTTTTTLPRTTLSRGKCGTGLSQVARLVAMALCVASVACGDDIHGAFLRQAWH